MVTGGSLDPLTGDCIYGPKIQLAAQRLQEAIQAVAEGTFQPGRTRGKGVVPWKYGFRDAATLHISSDSAGTVKFFLNSRQHHYREVFLKLQPAPFFFSFKYRIPFLAWIGSFPEPEADWDVVPNNTSGLSYEFFGGSFWSDRFAIWTNFCYNEPPFQFFCRASLSLFLL